MTRRTLAAAAGIAATATVLGTAVALTPRLVTLTEPPAALIEADPRCPTNEITLAWDTDTTQAPVTVTGATISTIPPGCAGRRIYLAAITATGPFETAVTIADPVPPHLTLHFPLAFPSNDLTHATLLISPA
jgi:hypothetical protein